jgi:subtilisin family serine protease
MFMNTAERFPDPVSANANRLKIAVLDTGLDTDHPDITHVLDRIWVHNRSDDIFGSCENSSVKDSKGHGTHIVGLVLEYAADADVYVADITEQGEVDHELVVKVRFRPSQSGVSLLTTLRPSCARSKQKLISYQSLSASDTGSLELNRPLNTRKGKGFTHWQLLPMTEATRDDLGPRNTEMSSAFIPPMQKGITLNSTRQR